jgi:hypothetical protein
MRTREGSALVVQRQRLINGLVESLWDAPFVFLLMVEADELWADRRSFQHWLAESGLKICTTIVPSGTEHALYKIGKDLPLLEVMKRSAWGTRRTPFKPMGSPKPSPSPTQ